jgi:hypothetical protein
VGVLVRILYLSLPLGSDEARTFVFYASRSLTDAVSDYRTPNNHVFHSVLVWFTTQVFGAHPSAIRAPAFVAGVAAIPAGFLVGRRVGGSVLGVGLAMLLAIAPPFVEFSAIARGYSIQLLAVLACLASSAAVLSGRRSGWVGLVAASMLGTWTVPSFVMPLGAIALWLAWVRRTDRRFLGELALAVAASVCLTTLLFAPAIWRSGWRALLTPSAWGPLAWSNLPRAAFDEFGAVASCWGGAAGVLPLSCLAVPIVVGVARRRRWALLVPATLLWLLVFTLIRQRPPAARTVHWSLLFVFLGAATVFLPRLQELRPRGRRAIVGLMLAGAATWAALSARDGLGRATSSGETATSCSDARYVDAEAVARTFARTRRERDLLVFPAFSGMTNPTRAYLMQLGLEPHRVFGVRGGSLARDALGFARWVIVLPTSTFDTSSPVLPVTSGSGDLLEEIRRSLGVRRSELENLVEGVEVLHELRVSRMYGVTFRRAVSESERTLTAGRIMDIGW